MSSFKKVSYSWSVCVNGCTTHDDVDEGVVPHISDVLLNEDRQQLFSRYS